MSRIVSGGTVQIEKGRRGGMTTERVTEKRERGRLADGKGEIGHR